MNIDGLDFVMRRIAGGAVPDLDLTDGNPAFASLIVDEETLLVIAQCCRTTAQNPRVAAQLVELGVLADANDRRPRLRAVSA